MLATAPLLIFGAFASGDVRLGLAAIAFLVFGTVELRAVVRRARERGVHSARRT